LYTYEKTTSLISSVVVNRLSVVEWLSLLFTGVPAISVHKGQGSQWPRIIIALQAGRIVDRAWLYTAITRAETEVHIVGSSDVFKSVTQSASNAHKRNSYLLHLLMQ
jgi:superfamily I DNA and RNA helicase